MFEQNAYKTARQNCARQKSSLKALLSLPKVWHYVQHPLVSNTSVMCDVCDGSVWSENELLDRFECKQQFNHFSLLLLLCACTGIRDRTCCCSAEVAGREDWL